MMGVMYLVGAALYALRVPESLLPGRFDTLGASHQLFHIAVVLAAVFHYFTLSTMFMYRLRNAQCPVA